MDFGYPQFTEAKILSEYIKTDAYKMEVSHCPGSQCSFVLAVTLRVDRMHAFHVSSGLLLQKPTLVRACHT